MREERFCRLCGIRESEIRWLTDRCEHELRTGVQVTDAEKLAYSAGMRAGEERAKGGPRLSGSYSHADGSVSLWFGDGVARNLLGPSGYQGTKPG